MFAINGCMGFQPASDFVGIYVAFAIGKQLYSNIGSKLVVGFFCAMSCRLSAKLRSWVKLIVGNCNYGSVRNDRNAKLGHSKQPLEGNVRALINDLKNPLHCARLVSVISFLSFYMCIHFDCERQSRWKQIQKHLSIVEKTSTSWMTLFLWDVSKQLFKRGFNPGAIKKINSFETSTFLKWRFSSRSSLRRFGFCRH